MRAHHRGPLIGSFTALVIAVAARPSDHRGSYGNPSQTFYLYVCKKPGCGARRKFNSKPRMPGGPRCKVCNSRMKREGNGP